MKEILGHKSWNRGEIIAILRRSGNFTMCSLPHSRYQRVKEICRDMERSGWIEKVGKTETSVNFKATVAFREWAFLDGSDLV